jgi:uncharacterized integral membrane protein
MPNTTHHDAAARPRGRSRPRDIKRIAAWIIVALLAAWLVAFIVSNSESVKISFVFGDVTLSLIWVMILCAVLGAILGTAIPRLLHYRRRRRERASEHR